MAAAVDRKTVVVAGSAPGFPHGVLDPIAELSEMARSRHVGFHADASAFDQSFYLHALRIPAYVPDISVRMPILTGGFSAAWAKKAALPSLCATLLSEGESHLRNVPKLRDIDTTAALLRFLGRECTVDAPSVLGVLSLIRFPAHVQPLRVGEAGVRTSTIRSVSTKSGRSGALVFVTVRHELSGANGLALLGNFVRHCAVARV